jgi:formylglycine-generating enzyme required for sulfatase activity
MTQVFLSHSSKDAEFALLLAADLRAAGIPVWKAPESILKGEEWVPAIQRGLTTSTHFLLLQSPAAVESGWVRFEFDSALELYMRDRIKIIMVDYESCHAPLFWGRFQQVTDIAGDYYAALFQIQACLRAEQPAHPPEPAPLTTTLNVGMLDSATYDAQPAAPPRRETREEFEPEMVAVPAGPFLMGSPESDELRLGDEREQFEMDLDYDYAIGKYPVTVGQYRAFIEAGGYSNRSFWTAAGWKQREVEDCTQPDYWDDKKWSGNDDLPVVGLSWYEAYAFTCWLAEATGRDYRLSTEAEWEKAARGGLQIPDGRGGMQKNPNPARIWPWGDEPPDDKRLNFNHNVGHTTPVGQYQKDVSPYGAMDMGGNVSEWCLSKWANPFAHPEDNDPERDRPRVVRGGSWYSNLQVCRVSGRLNGDPRVRNYGRGFRVGVSSRHEL